MRDAYPVVDELYATLGIQDVEKIPRNEINTGTLNRKLNTNCSAIMGNRQKTVWSSSARKFEKL